MLTLQTDDENEKEYDQKERVRSWKIHPLIVDLKGCRRNGITRA